MWLPAMSPRHRVFVILLLNRQRQLVAFKRRIE